LQFITTSTYRRRRLFTCQRFCWIFVETLHQLRQETGFLLIGWVLMPEHFHLRYPLGVSPQHSYPGGLDCPSQHQGIGWTIR
jgi:REP element-mobilizing transposase RayT